MSVVTNVIVIASCSENEGDRTLELNEKTQDRGNFKFWEPAEHVGGTKAFEWNMWTGAFNHVDVAELVAGISLIRWDRPDQVRIVIKGQEAEVPVMLEAGEPCPDEHL